MKILILKKTLITLVLFCSSINLSIADISLTSTYKTLVDKNGNITLPKNFREDWTFLGTWSIAKKASKKRSNEVRDHGADSLHNVYTQRGVAKYVRKYGQFPDGAVIVKELLKTVTGSMTTGIVSRGHEVEGWFIMVKDTQGRFSSNPLWGDGWGWALVNNDKTFKTVTKNYKTECLGCHIPARETDWIYLSGYPLLSNQSGD